MDYENLTPQYRIEEYLKAIVEGWAEATQYPYPDYPSWRIEEFLDAFITYIWEDGDHPRHPCPDPVWRLEECLRAIYDVMTGAATPWAFPLPTTNRIEEYLAAIHAYLVDNTELPVPEPVWRIEQWLAYVLDAVKQGGGVSTTVSGTMVHITNALAKAALSVLASIEPIQDLHGYANPWPAGGGKNLLPMTLAGIKAKNTSGTWTGDTYTKNGVSFSFSSQNGYVTAVNCSGNASATIEFYVADLNGGFLTEGVSYYISGCPENGAGDKYKLDIIMPGYPANMGGSGTSFTAPPTSESHAVRIVVYSGYGDGLVYKPMIRLASVTDATFAPYSNICPISGRTGLSVYVGPTQDPDDATTYAVDWTDEAGTVYGGTLDVVTGLLTVDRVCETITKDSAWSSFYTGTGNSSAGVYLQYYQNCKYVDGAASSNGAICSTGEEVPNYWTGPRQNESPGDLDMCFAYSYTGLLRFHRTDVANITDLNAFKAAFPDTQICYYLATPLTYQLSAQEVQMLLGENYVWSSSGDTVSVTYYAEGNANPLQSLNILLGGNYSNPKTADDVSDKEALDIILGGNK